MHSTISRGNPLSMVWKGRAKWGNNHQSSADDALQVRPGVWEVLLLPLSHIQGHPTPQPEELPAIHRRRTWWVIFFSLTASMRLTGLTFQRQDLGGGSEGGSDICQTATSGMPPPHWHGTVGGIWCRDCHPSNGCMHIIPIFMHPAQILVMWGCPPHKLTPLHCTWWIDYHHLRIWCEPMYPIPSARYICSISHLTSCMELLNITPVGGVKIK